jgi:dienelactone hydrolase
VKPLAADDQFEHLGSFSDWVAEARRQRPIYRDLDAPRLEAAEVRELLGFARDGEPLRPRVEGRWERDGIAGEEVSWSVGYGPLTRAWVLRPVEVSGPLPGVMALHGHDGFKFFGKEKVADGPEPAPEVIAALRRELYESTAFANELARRGFTVLAHDTFLWGSRRFAAELLRSPPRPEPEASWIGTEAEIDPTRDPIAYNRAALAHEHLIAKYCALLGTSLAGVVAFEDRVAAGYLRARGDVLGDRIGCVGLSGGGCRAGLLQASCEHVAATGVVGMMTTLPALLDHLVRDHTWMFFPPGLAARADWPDLVAARAPSPLLVQFNRDDQLFTPEGMRAADERLAARYRQAGAQNAYVGEFYEGPHKFDRAMQRSAFEHLEEWLRE